MLEISRFGNGRDSLESYKKCTTILLDNYWGFLRLTFRGMEPDFFRDLLKSHLSTVKARRSKSFLAFSGEIAALIDRFKMAKIQYRYFRLEPFLSI